MRRWLAILAALLVVPVWAFATGSLTIPHTIFTQPNPVSTGLLDQNYSAIASYINNREVSFGTLATRPVAGTAGRYYFATDQNGGTLYADNGTAWVQVAAGANANIAQQLTGLGLANNGTATATFTIAVGAATSDDAVIANRLLIVNAAAQTKSLAAWVVGAGGCLDTGTVTVFTWYSVFLITRTDTGVVDVLCSTSATAPTMPANYTKKRRIGSVRTDWSTPAGSIYFFTQTGDYFRWATTNTQNDVSTGASGVVAVGATLSTPNGVSTMAVLHVSSGNTSICYVSELTAADEAAGTALGQAGSSAGGTTFGQATVMTSAASSIRFRCSVNALISLTTVAYYDRRGQQ